MDFSVRDEDENDEGFGKHDVNSTSHWFIWSVICRCANFMHVTFRSNYFSVAWILYSSVIRDLSHTRLPRWCCVKCWKRLLTYGTLMLLTSNVTYASWNFPFVVTTYFTPPLVLPLYILQMKNLILYSFFSSCALILSRALKTRARYITR